MNLLRAWLLLPLLAGCAVAPDSILECAAIGGRPLTVIDLYFGRGGVSDSAWSGFLAGEVTPRFPDGLTVIDGLGQWRDPRTGRASREAASVITIAVERTAFRSDRVNQVIAAYRAAFRQQAVGRVVSERCGGFD